MFMVRRFFSKIQHRAVQIVLTNLGSRPDTMRNGKPQFSVRGRIMRWPQTSEPSAALPGDNTIPLVKGSVWTMSWRAVN